MNLAKLTTTILQRFCAQPLRHIVERPFTPQLWTAMSTSHIKTIPPSQYLQAIFHSVSLMYNNITPFNYDFYQWSCNRLIQNQQELTKDQILMMLRLSRKYKVKIEPFHQHIENQLFLRIHRDYQHQIQQYDQKIRRELQTMMKQFEQKSKDYFQIINQSPQQQQKEQQKPQQTRREVISQQEKYIANMSKKLSKKSRKSKEILHTDIIEIIQLLQSNGSKNIPLFQYILQLITIKYQNIQTITSNQMLQYIKLITYLCQHLMQEYQENKKKYTPRSIKRIYKFQLLYYHQHIRQLEIVKNKLDSKEIQELVKTYSEFPIKKREIRKNIAASISEEIKMKNLDKDMNFVKIFVDINGKDEKMKKTFCELLGIEPQQAKTLGLYTEKQHLIQANQQQSQGQQGQQQPEQPNSPILEQTPNPQQNQQQTAK